MTKATFIRTAFNWEWVIGSEDQFIIHIGITPIHIYYQTWQHPGRHGAGRAESSTFSSGGC